MNYGTPNYHSKRTCHPEFYLGCRSAGTSCRSRQALSQQIRERSSRGSDGVSPREAHSTPLHSPRTAALQLPAARREVYPHQAQAVPAVCRSGYAQAKQHSAGDDDSIQTANGRLGIGRESIREHDAPISIPGRHGQAAKVELQEGCNDPANDSRNATLRRRRATEVSTEVSSSVLEKSRQPPQDAKAAAGSDEMRKL